MDIATVIGILAGFAVILLAILSGTGAGMFINLPSIGITVGGMICSTLIHFSLGQVLNIMSLVKKTLLHKMPNSNQVVQDMVNYTAVNRRDGALALEKFIPQINDTFMIMGLRMVIDGQKEENIENQLGMEIQYLQERHADGKKILEFMGATAPAFGMIGTLIGLVQMLGSLSSPDQIGSGMATALITTFYGAILANLIFIPMAGKLGIRSKEESQMREMIVEGLLGIVKGEAPTIVREKMQAFLSYKNREELKPSI